MIGIIVALPQELRALEKLMENPRDYAKGDQKIKSGLLADKQVIVALSGIGKVNAALSAVCLINDFKASKIINIGSAGGLNDNGAIGDLVISTETAYHDVDVTVIGMPYGRFPNTPARFKAAGHLVEAGLAAADKTRTKASAGLIVSGDSFAQASDLKRIFSRFPDAAAVEMEGAAIGHVCHLRDKPYVVIRALSDFPAKPNNGGDFKEFLNTASRRAAALARELTKQL